MTKTPDRHPGPLDEDEEIQLGTQSTDPVGVGRMRYVVGSFRFQDSIGVFDPRYGGGLTEAQHKALRHLIHFIDDGPADGFASGAYKEVTGTVFPTYIVWWESPAKLVRIVERFLTWIGAKLIK